MVKLRVTNSFILWTSAESVHPPSSTNTTVSEGGGVLKSCWCRFSLLSCSYICIFSARSLFCSDLRTDQFHRELFKAAAHFCSLRPVLTTNLKPDAPNSRSEKSLRNIDYIQALKRKKNHLFVLYTRHERKTLVCSVQEHQAVFILLLKKVNRSQKWLNDLLSTEHFMMNYIIV